MPSHVVNLIYQNSTIAEYKQGLLTLTHYKSLYLRLEVNYYYIFLDQLRRNSDKGLKLEGRLREGSALEFKPVLN
jgi:hypothetical protein